jgi:tetratricopeptide (TPR) repeat protein
MLPLFTFEAQMEAQPDASHATEEIRGRIENLSAGRSALVVLRDGADGRLFDQATVDSGGEFRLRGAASSSRGYSLEVRDGQHLLHQEYVWSPPMAGDLTVSLPTPKVQPSSSETVSAARLLHAPPAKAAKLFAKAMAVSDPNESIELLEKAIDEHPDYIEARHNLAVRLGKLRQYDRAVQQLETVLQLDPSSAMAWASLGVTLDAMGDVPAAETAAKQALVLEPRSPLASLLLGSILLRQNVKLAYAAELLGNAADQFPLAGLLQVDALLAAGETAPARHALHSLVAAAHGVH